MNLRENATAILQYQSYEQLPIVHFGFWNETLEKWANEKHITRQEAQRWGDGNAFEASIEKKLGFDFNWFTCFHWKNCLFPSFRTRTLTQHPDGRREVMNENGVIIIEKDEAGSIPCEVDHLLKDRKSWEKYYLPRLEWSAKRINWSKLEGLKSQQKQGRPVGLHCGSLLGKIRDLTGLVGLSYLLADDRALVNEIIDVNAEIVYQGVKEILEQYDGFDFAHFWEDICYKAGPLINPKFFKQKIGPHYKRITELVNAHGIEIISLDCDGLIDLLVPTWLENGVNTMFPIEVGTWNGCLAPWRERYGKVVRGVGGMNKVVFSRDYAAVDEEIERLKPIVALGGFIPCPDHRIPPDAKWENVQYYCERMRNVFG